MRYHLAGVGILIVGLSFYFASLPLPVKPTWSAEGSLVCPAGYHFYPRPRLCSVIEETPAVLALTWALAAAVALPILLVIYRGLLSLLNETSH